MFWCLCALLLLASPHFTERVSTQQTTDVPQQGPNSLSSITLSSVTCVVNQDCLFQLNDTVEYQKIRTSFSGISFVYSCPVTCPSKTYYSQCVCCSQTLPHFTELLHTYLVAVEEYDRIYQAFETSPQQDQQLPSRLQNATRTLQTAANKLFNVCPEFVCREDECKYLRCHSQGCERDTTHTPIVTTFATATPLPSTLGKTTTPDTVTSGGGPVTTAAPGQRDASTQDGPNVAAVTLGVVLSVLVVAVVVFVVVCWWRRGGRTEGGASETKAGTSPVFAAGNTGQALQDSTTHRPGANPTEAPLPTRDSDYETIRESGGYYSPLNPARLGPQQEYTPLDLHSNGQTVPERETSRMYTALAHNTSAIYDNTATTHDTAQTHSTQDTGNGDRPSQTQEPNEYLELIG